MATSKQYAYYIEGGKIAVVEKDVSFDNDVDSKDYGPGASKQRWESPQSSVTGGLEIVYSYSPEYQVSPHEVVPQGPYNNVGHFVGNIFGWTALDGRLTFIIGPRSAADDGAWVDSAGNALTGDSGGLTNFFMPAYDDELEANNYILIQGSKYWDGIHKLTEDKAGFAQDTANTHSLYSGMIFTKTDVSRYHSIASRFTIHLANRTITDSTGSMDNLFDTDGSKQYLLMRRRLDNPADKNRRVIGGTYDHDSDTFNANYFYHMNALYNFGYNEADIAVTDTTGSLTAATNDRYFMHRIERDECKLYGTSAFQYLNNDAENYSLDASLPRYLEKALVYYVKGKLAEDNGDLKLREYAMREFKKMLEKHETSRITGPRMIASGSHSIR